MEKKKSILNKQILTLTHNFLLNIVSYLVYVVVVVVLLQSFPCCCPFVLCNILVSLYNKTDIDYSIKIREKSFSCYLQHY